MSTLVVETVPEWKFPEIELPESMHISPAGFKELCSRNQDLHAELSSDGNFIISAPTGGNSGWRNSKLTHQIEAWAEEQDNGIVFDSSTVFHLPNGSMRGPDAAWVKSQT
jgi:Uma2 family endonuclease